MLAVHAAVFPFDAQRALVADVVECHDDILKFDIAMAQRAEIPEPPRISEIHMAAENAHCAIAMTPPGVFHVNVENPLAERADEFSVADALISQMRWIIIEAK